MTDRKHMDRPAMGLSLALGLLLIASSLPFVVAWWETDEAFDIAWAKAEVARDGAPATGDSGSVTLDLPVTGAHVAEIHFEAPQCADSADGTLRGRVTVTWRVLRGNDELATGTFDCTASAAQRSSIVPVEPVPETSEKSAGNATEAAKAAMDDLPAADAAFRVQFDWARGDGAGLPTIPNLPGNPTFTATFEGEVLAWRAQASEKGAAT